MRRGVLAIVLAAATSSALAHDVEDPRVLVVVVTPASIEVRLNELFVGPEAEELRRRFDADRSGRLDDSEESDLASFLAIRSARSLRVEVDGKALGLATGSRVLRGARDAGTGALSLDLVLRGSGTLAGRDVTLRDARDDDHAVRAAVLATGGARLEAASLGTLDAGRGLVRDVSLDRENALTLRVRSEKTTERTPAAATE